MTSQPSATPLSRRIRKLRKAKGLSLRALATKMKVKAPSVLEWERGTSVPQVKRLGLLAQALDVTVNELLGLNEAA